MLVGELSENIAKRQESRQVIKFKNIEVANDAATISFKPEGELVQSRQALLDEQALAVLARYLKIPVPYAKECPPDERARMFRFWLSRKPDVQVAVETVNDGLVGLYNPDVRLLPVKEVGHMVERIFDPEDEIRYYTRSEERFHLDVTTHKSFVDVPNPDGVIGRPEVGDITNGGLRFLFTPNKIKAPSVSDFYWRLVCLNGMTTPVEANRISIKGLTVPEILASMEEAADRLLSTMDERLALYKKTATMKVPGHPVSFAEQLGHEAKLSQGIMHRVLENVRQLPEDASVYDVNQSFTAVAREAQYATRNRLQTLGGNLATRAPEMIERCSQCETLLRIGG